MSQTNNILDGRLYNIALDLYMALNCHRLCKILGDEFDPNWYYDGRDHQYIVLELNPDEAKSIWNDIKTNIDNIDTEFTGLKVYVNPICLTTNRDCHECYRNTCQQDTDKIAALCEKKCLDINYVLSKAWYAKAFETVQHFIEK